MVRDLHSIANLVGSNPTHFIKHLGLGLKGLSFYNKFDVFVHRTTSVCQIQPLHVKFFFIMFLFFRKNHIPEDTRVVLKKCQF